MNLKRIWCALTTGHQRRFERVKKRITDDAYSLYQDETGEWHENPIDAVVLADVCQKCGHEREVEVPVSVAERRGLLE